MIMIYRYLKQFLKLFIVNKIFEAKVNFECLILNIHYGIKTNLNWYLLCVSNIWVHTLFLLLFVLLCFEPHMAMINHYSWVCTQRSLLTEDQGITFLNLVDCHWRKKWMGYFSFEFILHGKVDIFLSKTLLY